jgi:hypothetical protein
MNKPSLELDNLLGPNLITYDPYDLWKTKLGVWLRSVYYRNGKLAMPLVAPFVVLDAYAPRLTRAFIAPQEYPIVRAMAALAALNFYGISSEQRYLELARDSVSWLINNRSPGYHGACWGLNFPWMTKGGYYSPTTPFITHTPYCIEALLSYHDVTKDPESYRVAMSTLDFLERDMQVLFEDGVRMAMGYGPGHETRVVVNANSYSMMLYAMLASRMPEKREPLFDKAARLFNFVKSCQNHDGSWLYYNDDEKGNFIDCFHSCLVMKNLIKYARFSGCDVSDIVSKGLDYVVTNFLDQKDHLSQRFTKSANPSLAKYDLYDQAELINVLLLSQKRAMAEEVLDATIEHFYLPSKGTFGYQIDIFGRLNKMTYLRWAVMPMVYVLSEYYKLK